VDSVVARTERQDASEKEVAMLPVRIPGRTEYDDLFDWMSRGLGRIGPSSLHEMGGLQDVKGDYPVDIEEDDEAITVEAEMPGFGKDEIEVRLDGNVLRIAAERGREERKATRHLHERRFTRIERRFTLSAEVDESRAEASLEDGVLKLRLPKAETSRSNRIELS
jgi:HSP20 family protein